jgi:hypothetical protein
MKVYGYCSSSKPDMSRLRRDLSDKAHKLSNQGFRNARPTTPSANVRAGGERRSPSIASQR